MTHNAELFRGVLFKKGVTNPSWKKRTFVLTSNNLAYFDCTDPKRPVLKGAIKNLDKYEVRDGPDNKSQNQYNFVLASKVRNGRNYLLYATTPEDKSNWIRYLLQYCSKEVVDKRKSVLETKDMVLEGFGWIKRNPDRSIPGEDGSFCSSCRFSNNRMENCVQCGKYFCLTCLPNKACIICQNDESGPKSGSQEWRQWCQVYFLLDTHGILHISDCSQEQMMARSVLHIGAIAACGMVEESEAPERYCIKMTFPAPKEPVIICVSSKDECQNWREKIEKKAATGSRGFNGNLKKFFEFCRKCNNSGLEDELRQGISLDSVDKNGNTGLHLCCSSQANENLIVQCVTMLINYRISTDQTNADGNTALHLACAAGKNNVVRALIQGKARLFIYNMENKTPKQVSNSTTAAVIEEEEKNILAKFLVDDMISLAFRGIDCNWQTSGGVSNLHLICRGEKYDESTLTNLNNNLVFIDIRDAQGKTPLYYAAEHGIEKLISILLRSGATIQIPDQNGLNPLHIAIINGRTNCAIQFLHGNKNFALFVNSPDMYGMTPLHYAVKEQNTKVVNELLNLSCIDVHLRNAEQRTPLALAEGTPVFTILESHVESIKFFTAVKADDRKLVEMILERKVLDTNKTMEGRTVLHIAARQGLLDMVKLLLKYGANPLVKDSEGNPPLTVARRVNASNTIIELLASHEVNSNVIGMVKTGSHEELQAFIEKERKLIDLNYTDDRKRTAAHWASDIGYEKCLEILVENRYPLDKQDNQQRTPCHYAAEKGKIGILNILLPHASHTCNIKDKDGNTPLLLSAEGGHTEACGLLLRYNARSDIVNNKGLSPKQIAQKKEKDGSSDLLQKFKQIEDEKNLFNEIEHHNWERVAKLTENLDPSRLILKVRDPMRDHLTPLLFAASLGFDDICKLLDQRGADPKEQDSKGRTYQQLIQQGQLSNTNDELKRKQMQLITLAQYHQEHFITILQTVMNLKELQGRGPKKDTILHFLCALGAEEAVTRVCSLLNKEPDFYEFLNAEDDDRFTPLHFAASSNSINIVKLLLSFKVAYIPNREMKYPKQLATYEEVISLLSLYELQIKYLNSVAKNEMVALIDCMENDQLDVNFTNHKHQTAVHIAVENNSQDCIDVLLLKSSATIDLSLFDNEGLTALERAKQKNLDRIVQSISCCATFPKLALHCLKGDAEQVKSILAMYPSLVRYRTKEGMTPLLLACNTQPDPSNSTADHRACVQTILNANDDIVATNVYKMTCLHFAALNDHVQLVELLAPRMAQLRSINAVDSRKYTAAHMSALGGGSTLKTLIENGADLLARDARDRTPLIILCSFSGTKPEHLKAVLSLCKPDHINAKDAKGNTALFYAVKCGNVKITQLLLEHRAETDVINEKDTTPLTLAVEQANMELISLLVQKGAKPYFGNEDGVTPLHVAAYLGHYNVLHTLLQANNKNNVDIKTKGEYELTPLHFAVFKEHLDCVKLLLAFGASAADPQETELKLIIRLFINPEINVELIRKGLNDQLIEGCMKGNPGMIENALSREKPVTIYADPNCITRTNETPLSITLKERSHRVDIIKILLDYGANPIDVENSDFNVTDETAALMKKFVLGNQRVSEVIKAVEENEIETVRTLLEDPSLCFTLEKKGEFFRRAVECEAFPVADYIGYINPSAVKSFNLKGQTALHISCETMRYNCIEYLLNTWGRDIDFRVEDLRGENAWKVAIRKKDLGAQTLLAPFYPEESKDIKLLRKISFQLIEQDNFGINKAKQSWAARGTDQLVVPKAHGVNTIHNVLENIKLEALREKIATRCNYEYFQLQFTKEIVTGSGTEAKTEKLVYNILDDSDLTAFIESQTETTLLTVLVVPLPKQDVLPPPKTTYRYQEPIFTPPSATTEQLQKKTQIVQQMDGIKLDKSSSVETTDKVFVEIKQVQNNFVTLAHEETNSKAILDASKQSVFQVTELLEAFMKD